MFDSYSIAVSAQMTLILVIVLQATIATVAHQKQQLPPGTLGANLKHDSFVFRSHRTHQNSLENAIQIFIPSFIAIFIGVDAFSLSAALWVYVISRILHMVLYYLIATEKNPSPRTYFYLISLTANFYVIWLVLEKLIFA
ncbi:MAPEG family protein [Marinomonas mediterranea]|uniref:MAPEG family protein n=1 Tax=Marinomonas mediterranea TaxID=119864 RepID=UPI002349DCA2|nr:MAPEG family protein [Marinomonas mediterranea]WCN11539.1 MAPEG family protein [Marinomonas mediterranea]